MEEGIGRDASFLWVHKYMYLTKKEVHDAVAVASASRVHVAVMSFYLVNVTMGDVTIEGPTSMSASGSLSADVPALRLSSYMR